MTARPMTDADVEDLLRTIRAWFAERRTGKADGGTLETSAPQPAAMAPQQPSGGAAQPITDFRTAMGIGPVSLPSVGGYQSGGMGLGSGIDPRMMAAAQAQIAAPQPTIQAPPSPRPGTNGQFFMGGEPIDQTQAMMMGLMGGIMGRPNVSRAVTWEGSGRAPTLWGMMGGQEQPIRPFAANGGGINSVNSALRIARAR